MSGYPGEGSLSPIGRRQQSLRRKSIEPIAKSDGKHWSPKAKAAYGVGNCRRCHTKNYPVYAFTPLCDSCLDWEIAFLKKQNETGGKDYPDGA